MKKIITLLSYLILIFTTTITYADRTSDDINKKNVSAFYNEIINEKNFDAALKYIGPYYTQHNPKAADGTEGLKNYVQYLRETYPSAHAEIKRIFSDNDFVILHVHTLLEPNTKGLAIVDIFRLENNKIVEHWDVIQDIPEKSANDNGMF